MAKKESGTIVKVGIAALLLMWLIGGDNEPPQPKTLTLPWANGDVNSSGTPSVFIQSLLPAFQAEVANGVPLAFNIAQAALESGWGNSDIAKNANNLFGIKADSSWTGDTYATSNGTFRKYASVADSIADHTKFLKANSNYADAFNHSDDSNAFAASVAAGGYAGNDPNYITSLDAVINTVNPLLPQ